ncbi:MAG: DUF3987 domain-containing protein [Planctomycetes bacterium]|nr:DUF3987 domain-containing protein [Planctomycetota bacterium]
MSTATTALNYIRRGWCPVPIPHKQKGPIISGWQNLRINEDNLSQYFNGQLMNVGVLLGAPSGLIDIDLDCPEAVKLAPQLLPPTGSIFGRKSKPGSHRLYEAIAFNNQGTKKVKDSSGKCLVELRCTGGQTVFPGSVHPSGEDVVWEIDETPQSVDLPQLLIAVQELAAACLILRHYPSKGSRHDLALALAGWLLRQGWSVHKLERFIEVVAEAAGDDEVQDRIRVVADSKSKIDQAAKATGWPALSKLIGEDIAITISNLLSVDETTNTIPTAIASTWDQPCKLTNTPVAPVFPIDDAFPPSLIAIKEYLLAEAESLQVPIDLFAMTLLPIVTLAAAKKVEIRLGPDWFEPSALWTLALLPSAERKSQAQRRMQAPLTKWEREKCAELKPLIARQKQERSQLEARLKYLTNQAAKQVDERKLAEAEGIAEELSAMEMIIVPQLFTSEPTPEAAGELLSESGGKVLIMSAEADSLDVALGRYSKTNQGNYGLYLCGHSGDDYRSSRVGRGRINLERPSISFALAVQPSSVDDLFSSKQAKGRGFVARFLKCRPHSLLGHRNTKAKAATQELKDLYNFAINNILEFPKGDTPLFLSLSSEAQTIFDCFTAKLELELGSRGDLAYYREWSGKLCGALGRIALVLHCLAEIGLKGESAHCKRIVEADIMRAALSWTPYLIEQEKLVCGLAELDPDIAMASRILSWIARSNKEKFSLRDAHTSCRYNKMRLAEFVPAIELLKELEYIRPAPTTTDNKTGRPASIILEVNPMWDRSLADE